MKGQVGSSGAQWDSNPKVGGFFCKKQGKPRDVRGFVLEQGLGGIRNKEIGSVKRKGQHGLSEPDTPGRGGEGGGDGGGEGGPRKKHSRYQSRVHPMEEGRWEKRDRGIIRNSGRKKGGDLRGGASCQKGEIQRKTERDHGRNTKRKRTPVDQRNECLQKKSGGGKRPRTLRKKKRSIRKLGYGGGTQAREQGGAGKRDILRNGKRTWREPRSRIPTGRDTGPTGQT